MSVAVEVSEAIIGVLAAREIACPQVVTGKGGPAVGALRAQVGGVQVTDPGVVAVVSENGGAAAGTALVDVDVVGAGPLGFGKLAPEGCVVLLKPPAQGLHIDLAHRRVLERLCALSRVPIASKRPPARPLGPVVAVALAQLLQGADLDDECIALTAAFGAEGIVAACLRSPEVVHESVVGWREAAVDQLERGELKLGLGAWGLDRQTKGAAGQQQTRCPADAESSELGMAQ